MTTLFDMPTTLQSRRGGAPDPGVVITDETPEFEELERSVMDALCKAPRKEPQLAGRPITFLPLLTANCTGCS